MKNVIGLIGAVAVILIFLAGCVTGPKVMFIPGEHKIDVMIGESHATTYRYEDGLTKPILYPLRTLSGLEVNRGFPLAKREGESEDHPHHTGLFFTYDRVNDDGFWNNTTSPPRIKHVRVTRMIQGTPPGRLSVVLHWVGKSGKVLLEEKREMVFHPEQDGYAVDFLIDLFAQDEQVVFDDTKEGMFGIRVASWLREQGGTGRYLSSNGDETEKNVWGKRAKWVRLEGEKDGKAAGIAILNHPESVNYPTYWHARAYGLFAANPLGQYVFEKSRGSENPQPFKLTLRPGHSASFRFRVIVYEGRKSMEQVEAWFEDYVH